MKEIVNCTDLLKDYGEVSFKNINDNKNELIDSFTEFYGEEYRDFIKNKIENIKFHYFYSSMCYYQFYNIIIDTIKKEIDKISKKYNLNISDYIKDDGSLIKIITDKKSTIDGFFDDFMFENDISIDIVDKIRNDYFSYTKTDTFNKLLELTNLLSEKDYFPINFISDNFNNYEQMTIIFSIIMASLAFHILYKEKNQIFFSVFSSDNQIIHEINHAVTSHTILNIKNDGDQIVNRLTKYGLFINSNEKEDFFDEILNDRSAIEINEIFHKKGLSISKIDSLSNLESEYSTFFPLIEKFYQKYKNVINKARISDDSNYIYKYIDKAKLHEFIENIYDVYTNNLEIDEELISKFDNFVNDMDNKEKEDLNEMVKEAKRQKKKVIFINNNDNDEFILKIENIKNSGIYLPEDYVNTDEIIATFYEMCIRFYKNEINLANGRFIIFDKNIRDFIRAFYTHQADYKIENGIIKLNNSSKYARLYEFKKKLLMVKNSNYFDIVELNNIKNYLDKMGLDDVPLEEIENKGEIVLKRDINYKPKYWFKK